MAGVFLSYDRVDTAKAGALAVALEKAGHTVWWDRHIKGGAEYSREIEQALKSADAVVVLWSEHSIESAWVRDEAAAGRDIGRLIPVLLDPVIPPMGFRQYQTVDLTRWQGRGRPPVKAILVAIERILEPVSERTPGDVPMPPPRPPANPRIRRSIILFLAIAVLAGGLALWVSRPWAAGSAPPVVKVAAATSTAADTEASADLLVKLGVLQAAHADTLQLAEPDSTGTPDFVIKVAGAGDGDGTQAQLRLLDNRDDTLLWAHEFGKPGTAKADLRQEVAYSAGKVLDCTVEALSAREERIELPTLKLYLNGCANLSNLLAQDPRTAVAIFAKVTKQAPKFEGAWKKLLLAEIQVVRTGGSRQSLQQRLVEARRYYPAIAEGFLAEPFVRQPSKVSTWIRLTEQAVAKDPDNPELLSYISLAHTNVGLMQEALGDARRAVRADPLSPAAREALITAMLNVGDVQAARKELESAEQLWPGATSVLGARFAVEFRVGDAARALALLKSGELGPRYTPPSPRAFAAHESYLKARIQPTVERKRQAVADARAFYARDPNASWVVARALSEFGSVEELIRFLMTNNNPDATNTTWTIFRASFAPLHRDPRFMAVAAKLGLVDYWRESGKWPDFCSAADLPYDCKAEAQKVIRS